MSERTVSHTNKAMEAQRKNDCYERWQEVVTGHGPRLAVRDAATGESWTFDQLAALGETAPSAPPVLVTSTTGMAFLLDVLRAWRCGSVLLPDDATGITAPSAAVIPGAACHIKVTSGSEGTRRMVLFTADQLAADAHQIVKTMGLHAEQPNVGVISMAHSFGFSNLVLPLLWHGIPLWLVESPLPHVMRTALADVRAVNLPAVPAMWRAWHQAGLDLRSVRTAISAGAPLPLSLEQEVHEGSGLKIHTFYGCSECGGITYDATSSPREKASVAGTALHGVDLSIREERLTIQSRAVGLGYLGEPEWTPGFYTTADQASVDARGQVHLHGRQGETISVAGYKVAPAMVEEALLRLPGVRHCVVFGVPSRDPCRIEDVVACLRFDDGLSLVEIQRSVAHLPAACIPRHWWRCPELAPDARGKFPRHYWRQRWLKEPRSRSA